jgi:hypothetical protein
MHTNAKPPVAVIMIALADMRIRPFCSDDRLATPDAPAFSNADRHTISDKNIVSPGVQNGDTRDRNARMEQMVNIDPQFVNALYRIGRASYCCTDSYVIVEGIIIPMTNKHFSVSVRWNADGCRRIARQSSAKRYPTMPGERISNSVSKAEGNVIMREAIAAPLKKGSISAIDEKSSMRVGPELPVTLGDDRLTALINTGMKQKIDDMMAMAMIREPLSDERDTTD